MLTPSAESILFTPFEKAGAGRNIPDLSLPSILCVGSDPTLLYTRQLLLENNGYRVIACSATDLSDVQLLSDFNGVLICHSVRGGQLNQLLIWLEERLPRDKILLTEALQAFHLSGIHRLREGYCVVASERPETLLKCLQEAIPRIAETNATSMH